MLVESRSRAAGVGGGGSVGLVGGALLSLIFCFFWVFLGERSGSKKKGDVARSMGDFDSFFSTKRITHPSDVELAMFASRVASVTDSIGSGHCGAERSSGSSVEGRVLFLWIRMLLFEKREKERQRKK